MPQNPNLIAQEFFLFENTGSDDLEYYTDSQYSKARMSIHVPFTDAADCLGFVKLLSEHYKTNYPDATTCVTGLRILLNQTFTNAIITMQRSYILAFGVVAIIMVLLLGNIRFGILSMVPNLAPILIVLGVMGFMGIKMDLFTMLVGSIVIGMVVDDTIHFFNSFMKCYSKKRDINAALIETFNNTGSAMLITTIVLATGFGVNMFSSMANLSDFGFVVSLAIVIALFADFFMAPSMIIIFRKFLKIESEFVAENKEEKQ